MRISARKLARIIKSFRGRRLAVVGDLMLDCYVWGKAARLSPEAPVPVVDFLEEKSVPGGAGNVAANLAALGARALVFGVVGDDAAGELLQRAVKAAKVSTAGILADSSRGTTIKTRVIAGHQQVVRVDREQRAPLEGKIEERLIRRTISHLRGLDAVVFSDYDKGAITEQLAQRVLGACQRLGLRAFVKPRWSREFAYPGAHAVVLNRAEAAFLVRHSLDDEAAIDEGGSKLLAHFGCPVVVLTLGEKGMRVFEEDSARGFHVPATSLEISYARLGLPGHAGGATGRQVFDVTGAGDTVIAVLALASAARASIGEAAVLANAAAGVAVGKLGTATVTRTELTAAIHDLD